MAFIIKRNYVEDFNTLKVIYKIQGKLQNLTPIRIGTGGAGDGGEALGSPVDLTVLKLRNRPYIPASSLKGLFRSHLERISAAKYGEENIHDPFEKDINKRENNVVCAICGIFGNITLASHITIFDSLIEGEATYHYKPGVGISRKFGSVAQGPFIEEYVEPGHRWSFEMNILNINLEQLTEQEDPRPTLLISLLRDLEKGMLQLGARKSIGAGLIKLIRDETRVYKTYVEDGEVIHDKEVEKPW